VIDEAARKGDAFAFEFPKTDMPGLNFSFSGIKTAFLYFIQDHVKKDPDFIKRHINDLSASLQRHLVQMLIYKLSLASEETGIVEIGIAGGVSANSGLRSALEECANIYGWKLYLPKLEYCTDNAAMIAITGYHKYIARDFSDLNKSPSARYKF